MAGAKYDAGWRHARREHSRSTAAHLRAVAYRMLGSLTEADDAVQEAWLRMDRTDVGDVRNLRGWLTTVVARICLDMLRARSARPEEPLDEAAAFAAPDAVDPEAEAVLADSIGVALLVILQTLTPAERLAFVLHDMFDLPYAEIAPIVGRTENTAAQLAARARRRVRGKTPDPATDLGQPTPTRRSFLRRCPRRRLRCTARGARRRCGAARRRDSGRSRHDDPRRPRGGHQCAGVLGQRTVRRARRWWTAPSASSSPPRATLGAGAALHGRRRHDHRDRHRRRPAAATRLQFGRDALRHLSPKLVARVR